PQVPRLQRRSAQDKQAPRAPFTLSPEENRLLDRVLTAWEQRSKTVKTFDCNFKRWEYDPVFVKPGSDPNAPLHVDYGILKYAVPDKGVFRVLKTENSQGKVVPVEEERADHWICDGKSIFQYAPRQKRLIEHKLPPDLQGKSIVDGPLPFLFGAEAKKLRGRYFLRMVSPPPERKNEIWLEAYPRLQTDAANFRSATLALSAKDMTPKALQLYLPNGKARASYEFYDIVVNDPLRVFQGNPFQAFTPRGWQKVVDEQPAAQAGRPSAEIR
ncbi:MAG: TIGR03009 domain-containing protein, partial [Thermoguttaceae bacterium]